MSPLIAPRRWFAAACMFAAVLACAFPGSAGSAAKPSVNASANAPAKPASAKPAVAAAAKSAGGKSFNFDAVVAKAKALAAKSFQPPTKIPDFLRQLDHHTWKAIHYRAGKALWHAKPFQFEVTMVHPGNLYEYSVPIRVVNKYGVGRLAFEEKRFVYPNDKLRAKVPEHLGYAGFRLYRSSTGDTADDAKDSGEGPKDHGANAKDKANKARSANSKTRKGRSDKQASAKKRNAAGKGADHKSKQEQAAKSKLSAVNSLKNEFAAFMGASYFRGLGAGQVYGLSARGLAVDTALPIGEEFPYFKAFWLQQPAPGDDRLIVYALLDSASVAGAYEFVMRPGDTTVMDVRVRLFTRADIAKLGIAPLTSMFMFGENQTKRVADYRPEVHDSDGLLVAGKAGKWLWRPLRNPKKLAVEALGMKQELQGFGLMQRDRNFDHYQDLDAHYEKRPSAWVTPRGNWGAGQVELVEIPSNSDKNDNIVAYWVPRKPVTAGESLHYRYRLSWNRAAVGHPPSGKVVATRMGDNPAAKSGSGTTRRVVIDFAGGKLAQLAPKAAVGARVTVGNDGQVVDARAIHNPHTHGWRLICDLKLANTAQPLEMRAYLVDAQGNALTETWSDAL